MNAFRLSGAVCSLAAASFLLAGCAAPAASKPAADVAEAADIASCDPAESSLTVTFGGQAADAMTVAVAALQEEYPELEISAEPAPTTSYDELTNTIVADIAVGKRPDVIMSGLGKLRFWVDSYEPAPIDVDALPSTYQKQFLDAGTIDGVPYLAPAQISTPVLLVNQDMLDEAGAGDAEDIRTFDDMVEVAEAVNKKTGAPSASIPAQGLSDWFTQAFTQGSGETFIAEDGTAAFDSPKAIEAVSVWSRLGEKSLELGVGDAEAMAAFSSGRVALLVFTTSQIANIQKAIADSFEFVAVDLPDVDGGDGPMPAGGNGWIVLSDDPCRAAFANALVSKLLSTEAVMAASGASFSYIPVDSAAGEELLALDGTSQPLEYAWSYDKPLSPWGGFDGEHTAEINDTIRTMAQRLATGAEAEATVTEATEAINRILEK